MSQQPIATFTLPASGELSDALNVNADTLWFVGIPELANVKVFPEGPQGGFIPVNQQEQVIQFKKGPISQVYIQTDFVLNGQFEMIATQGIEPKSLSEGGPLTAIDFFDGIAKPVQGSRAGGVEPIELVTRVFYPLQTGNWYYSAGVDPFNKPGLIMDGVAVSTTVTLDQLNNTDGIVPFDTVPISFNTLGLFHDVRGGATGHLLVKPRLTEATEIVFNQSRPVGSNDWGMQVVNAAHANDQEHYYRTPHQRFDVSLIDGGTGGTHFVWAWFSQT